LELRGLSHPVSLCAPAAELDVTPCVEEAEVHVQEPTASIDKEGHSRFAQDAPSTTIVESLRRQSEVSFSIEVGGRTLMGLHWPVSFSLPEPLEFAAKPGLPGPDLEVRVESLDAKRLLLTVKHRGQSYLAVVEREEATQFTVVSRGGNGKPGGRTAGSLDGGAGEEGAPGGNIVVQVVCATTECGGLPTLARRMVDSQGGAGGSGGAGGEEVRITPRGRGRRSSGPSQHGKRGPRGADGPPGRVEVVLLK
jgi:hypothetical protein